MRNIETIINPPAPHFVGDGFRVHNFIPSIFPMERTSPFIMLDYGSPHFFEPSETPRGVGVHPHRGFETVTIAYQGKVEHHDSYGGGGIIEEGDVQWMTAAKGVLHKEFHEKEFSKNGGWFQMVQLWVNLPSKYKMSEPKYQAISNTSIAKHILENNQGIIEVIAGNHQEKQGIAKTFTPITMLNAKLNKGAMETFSFPPNYNTLALVIEGNITINNDNNLTNNQIALFKNDAEDFSIKANANSIVLILSGEPINEPIAAHGPFVMNTRQEILQAFQDYNDGKFGILEE